MKMQKIQKIVRVIDGVEPVPCPLKSWGDTRLLSTWDDDCPIKAAIGGFVLIGHASVAANTSAVISNVVQCVSPGLVRRRQLTMATRNSPNGYGYFRIRA